MNRNRHFHCKLISKIDDENKAQVEIKFTTSSSLYYEYHFTFSNYPKEDNYVREDNFVKKSFDEAFKEEHFDTSYSSME